MVHFGEFLKTWSLRSNSVTRQVNFNRSKIGGKCQNWKPQMRLFGWISNTYCEVSRFLALKFKYSTLTGVGGTCDQTSNAVLGARLCGTIFQTLGGAMNAANAVCGKDRYNFNWKSRTNCWWFSFSADCTAPFTVRIVTNAVLATGDGGIAGTQRGVCFDYMQIPCS